MPAPSLTTWCTMAWRLAAAACASTGEAVHSLAGFCGLRSHILQGLWPARSGRHSQAPGAGARSSRMECATTGPCSCEAKRTSAPPLPPCRRDIQQAVFATIGLSEEEARGKFGYLMDSFELGAPPHGGEYAHGTWPAAGTSVAGSL